MCRLKDCGMCAERTGANETFTCKIETWLPTKAFFSQPGAALSQHNGWSIWRGKNEGDTFAAQISGLPGPLNRAMIHLAFCYRGTRQ